MSRTSFNEASVNKLVLEAFGSGFDNYQTKYQSIFNVFSPERQDELFSITARESNLQELPEGSPYPSAPIKEIGRKELQFRTEYKDSINVSKLMNRFDNYSAVIREANKLGYNMKVQMDKIGAAVLNNATSAAPEHAVWDGLSLANAAHKIGETGNTQSNIVNGALGESTLVDMYTLMQTQQDHAGNPQPMNMATVVYHPSKAQKVYETLRSPNDPESGNRNVNFLYTFGYDFVEHPLLTNTEDVHLLAGKNFHRLMYGIALAPEVNKIKAEATGGDLYQCCFSAQAGAVDYIGYGLISN